MFRDLINANLSIFDNIALALLTKEIIPTIYW